MMDDRFGIHFDPMGDLGRYFERRVEDGSARVRHVPHDIGNTITDSGRGFHPRRLTPGETRLVVEAWSVNVLPESVRIVNGPGTSPIAAAAFHKGNPAITLGNTIHICQGSYRSDLSRGGPEDKALLVHEWTHVVQYAELGYAAFGARYGRDMRRVSYDDSMLYRYWLRRTTWFEETLEGQAEMAGVLTKLRVTNRPEQQAARRALEQRMEGSRCYGL